MKYQKGFTIVQLFIIILFVLGAGGWIANIVKLTSVTNVFEIMSILRIAGIFVAPLGSILGFI